MAETIVDTSLIIDYLRGHVAAGDFLEHLRATGELATHTVVVAEALGGARDLREQREIEQLFREFRIHSISEADAAASLGLLKEYRLSRGVGWLDCLIAATARRTGLPVATLDEKHFTVFEGLAVHRPY